MRNTEDLYRARLKEFKNGKIKLREYKSLMWKPKKKEQSTSSTTKKRVLVEGGQITRRSLAKTRNTLTEIVENNEGVFKSFITLTYREEIEDINVAYKDLQSYFKSCKRDMKKQNKELMYLAVPEIQKQRARKTGKYVIHFHIITNIEIGSHLIPKREKKNIIGAEYKGTRTIEYYDVVHWNKGWSIAIPIKHQGEFELSKYLLKYLYKDLDNRFYGRQKLLHSNNLKTPEFAYFIDNQEIDKIKQQNKPNIKEVYSTIFKPNEIQFVDYVYKAEKGGNSDNQTLK